jgi:hypothetical protein
MFLSLVLSDYPDRISRYRSAIGVVTTELVFRLNFSLYPPIGLIRQMSFGLMILGRISRIDSTYSACLDDSPDIFAQSQDWLGITI